jgi:predicted O-methyltransferase YrrM
MLRHITVFSAALATALAQGGTPTVRELLDRYQKAAGGRTAIDSITSEVRTGTYSMRQGAPLAPMEVQSKAPEKWRFRFTIPGVVVMDHCSNGSQGWFVGSDQVQQMDKATLYSETIGTHFRTIYHPEEFFKSLKLKGKETRNGREVWVVEGTPAEGKPMDLEFDTQTGLLAAIGWNIFEDWRTVGAAKAPFRVKAVQGSQEAVLQSTEVRQNVPIEDARFEKDAVIADNKRAMREMTAADLAAALKGIETGAALPVLQDLHGFGPSDGRFLYDLVASKGYKRGLEIGTARGNSAVWMGMAFRKNGGKLTTIEMNPEAAKAATENFRTAGLTGVVECRNADAFKEIPAIEDEFDFIFMDTGTALHKKFLVLVQPRVVPGGAIVSHNANEFERRMPDFLEAITKNPKLDMKITRTPTGGFSVSTVNGR